MRTDPEIARPDDALLGEETGHTGAADAETHRSLLTMAGRQLRAGG